VNQAAISNYEFSAEEFLALKITELYPAEIIGRLLETAPSDVPREVQHRGKDGCISVVELSLRTITWSGRPAGLLLANDITEPQTNGADGS